jgi:predicted dehydrogenase
VLPAFAHAKENSELVALVSGDKRKTDGKNRAGMHWNDRGCFPGQNQVMIAYRLHFKKGNLSAMQAIKDGAVGEPRIFRSAFCQQVTPGNSRLCEENGAGPLYNIGVYCINAARYLFRAEPEAVFAYTATSKDKRFAEVEEMSAAVMKFPADRLASFTCSFGAADRSSYEVIGTKDVLKMDPAYEMVGDLKCELTVDGKTQKTTCKKRDQFGPELVYFSNCVLNGTEPEPGGAEGLADVCIINALLESQQRGRPVAISEVDTGKRPTPEQGIHKPVVAKPELVRATAPSK